MRQTRNYPGGPNLAITSGPRQSITINSHVTIPDKAKFLVVDGQHRLWAQNFSQKDGQYACIIHLGKTEKEMAELFLEINENQRRVPSRRSQSVLR
jgi:hypothetical protein